MNKFISEFLLCPRCASSAVQRSHRRGIERLLSLLAVYPFRCQACHSRFWRLAVKGRAANAQRASHNPRSTRGGGRPLTHYNNKL
jgi:hypothetical protein